MTLDTYTVTTIEGRPAIVLDEHPGSVLVAHLDHLSPWQRGARHDPTQPVPFPEPGETVAVAWDAESEGNWIWVEARGGRYTAHVSLYLVRSPGQTDAEAVAAAGLDETNLLPHPYGRGGA